MTVGQNRRAWHLAGNNRVSQSRQLENKRSLRLSRAEPPDSSSGLRKNLEYATRACELSQWKDFSYLDTLAASYAEVGDFKAAVKWQTKAIELAFTGFKSQLRSRLKLYEANQPYRATSDP
jgi:hypothetical protein